MGYQPIRNPKRSPSAAAPSSAAAPQVPPSAAMIGAGADGKKSGAGGHSDTKPGLTPEEHSALSGDREFLLQGLSPGSSAALMMEAAFDGNAGRMKTLLDKGDTLPDFENALGFTPMMIAAARGNASVVETLAAHPLADLGRQHRNGWTALHFAARFGHVKTVSSLLSHFAPLDLKTRDGKMAHELAEGLATEKTFWENRHFLRFIKSKEPANPRLLSPQQEAKEEEQAPQEQQPQQPKGEAEPVKGAFIRAIAAIAIEMKEKPGMNVRAQLNEKLAGMDEATFNDAFKTIKSTKLKYDWEDVFIRAAGAGNTTVMSTLQEHFHFEGRALTRALSAAIATSDQRDAVHHLLMWGADADASLEIDGKKHNTAIHRYAFIQKRTGAFEEMVLWGGLLGGITAFDDYEKKAKMNLTLRQVSRIRIQGQKAPSNKERLLNALKEADEKKLIFAIQLWRKKRELKGTRSKKLKNIFNAAVQQQNIGVIMAAYAEARQNRIFRGKVEMDRQAAGNAMATALMAKRYEFARMLAADGYRLQDATPDRRFMLDEKSSKKAKELARIFMTAKEKPKPIEEIGKIKLTAADAALYTGGMYGMGRFGM